MLPQVLRPRIPPISVLVERPDEVFQSNGPQVIVPVNPRTAHLEGKSLYTFSGVHQDDPGPPGAQRLDATPMSWRPPLDPFDRALRDDYGIRLTPSFSAGGAGIFLSFPVTSGSHVYGRRLDKIFSTMLPQIRPTSLFFRLGNSTRHPPCRSRETYSPSCVFHRCRRVNPCSSIYSSFTSYEWTPRPLGQLGT